jgi:hypothetical protein
VLLCRRVAPGSRPVLPTATPPITTQDSDQSIDSQINGGRAAFAHKQLVLDKPSLAKTSMKPKLTDEERLARLLKEQEREKKRRMKEERQEARRKREQEKEAKRAEKERGKRVKEEARMQRLREKEAREEERRKEKRDKEEAKAAKEEAAKAAREAEKDQRKREKSEEAKKRKEAANAAREEAAKLPGDAQKEQRKKEEERQKVGGGMEVVKQVSGTGGGPVKERKEQKKGVKVQVAKGKTGGVHSRTKAGGKGGPGKVRAKGGRGKSVATRSGGLKDKKKTMEEAEGVEERGRERGSAKDERRGPGRKAAKRGAGKNPEEETGAKNAEQESDGGEARKKRETRKRVGAHEDGESGPAKRTRRSERGGADDEEKITGGEVGVRQTRKRRREEAGLVPKEDDDGEVALSEKGENRTGKKSLKKARASKGGDDGEQGPVRGDEASQVEEKGDEPSRKEKEGGRKGQGRREVEHETDADKTQTAGEEGVGGGRRRTGGARVRVETGGGNAEGAGQAQAAHKYDGTGQGLLNKTRKGARQEETDGGVDQDVFEVESARVGGEVRRSRRLSNIGVEKGEGTTAQEKSASSESEEDGPVETAADRTPARSPEKRTRAKKTPAEGAADNQLTLHDATKPAEVEVEDGLGAAGSPLQRASPRRGARASGLAKGNGKDGLPANGRGARRAGKEERQRREGQSGQPEDALQEILLVSRQRKEPGRGGRVAGGTSPLEKKQGASGEVIVKKRSDETSQATLRRSARSSKRQPR